jgi:SAM-dependent methyltransferase
MSAARERLRSLLGSAAILARELRAVPAEARRHRPQPPSTGLVLDIGAGQSPHPRADVMVEKYPVDDFERPGEAGLSLAKPLVVADGAHLPFADSAFAYVIASHVLEHAPDPVRFASEMARVAPAGFVQVPSRESELIYGWPYHPWLIDRTEHGLRFCARHGQRAPGYFMHEHFAESLLHRPAWAAHRSRWHHSVEWRGALEVTIAENGGTAERTADFEPERTLTALRALSFPPLPPAVRAALRCPSCRGALRGHADHLECAGCGRSYPVASSVPLLVEEAADLPSELRRGAASTRS